MKIPIVLVAVLTGSANVAVADIVMTFEAIPGDIQAINDFSAGVEFFSSSSGSPLVTRRASTGLYNLSSAPSGTQWGTGQYWIYGDVGVTSALNNSGDDGKISFGNEDATYVTIAYSANSTFTMEAYSTSGFFLDTDSGPANLRYSHGNSTGPGSLTVNWDGTNYISYVIVYDAGNFWIIDNVQTDASGVFSVIPLPSASAMAGLGLLGLGMRRRRVNL